MLLFSTGFEDIDNNLTGEFELIKMPLFAKICKTVGQDLMWEGGIDRIFVSPKTSPPPRVAAFVDNVLNEEIKVNRGHRVGV